VYNEIHFSAGAEFLNCGPMALFTLNLSCKLISLASHDLSVQEWVFSPDLHLPAQPARETETHYHWSLRIITAKGGAKKVSPSLLKNEAFIVNRKQQLFAHPSARIGEIMTWSYGPGSCHKGHLSGYVVWAKCPIIQVNYN